MSNTLAKIDYFGTLPDRWDGTRATKYTPVALECARNWCKTLVSLGVAKTDAFPGEHGEIVVTGYNNGVCFEITIESDGSNTIDVERYRPATSPDQDVNPHAMGKFSRE